MNTGLTPTILTTNRSVITHYYQHNHHRVWGLKHKTIFDFEHNILMHRWQNKDTLYTGYNDDKNWPHPQNRNTSLIARVHDSKWVVYLAGKEEPESWTNGMTQEWLCGSCPDENSWCRWRVESSRAMILYCWNLLAMKPLGEKLTPFELLFYSK